jgi:hypothetical protein
METSILHLLLRKLESYCLLHVCNTDITREFTAKLQAASYKLLADCKRDVYYLINYDKKLSFNHLKSCIFAGLYD